MNAPQLLHRSSANDCYG